MSSPKTRIATVWLSGCSGCHMSFLDLDERLFDLVKLVDLVASPIVDVKEIPEADVGIVEGAVGNVEQEEVLHTLRKRCKILVAFGDCAMNGNIPALRNPYSVDAVVRCAFVETESTQIGEMPNDPSVPALCKRVSPVHELVKVDAFIPGCPPDADAIWYAVTELLAGRMPKWDEKNMRYD